MPCLQKDLQGLKMKSVTLPNLLQLLLSITTMLVSASCGSRTSGNETVTKFEQTSIAGVKYGNVAKTKVVRAQTGVAESEFQESQSRLYERFPAVEKAFLVRARHEGETEEVVLLILSPESAESPELIEAITKNLKEVSKGKPPLDIMFADLQLLKDAEAVTEPFYLREP